MSEVPVPPGSKLRVRDRSLVGTRLARSKGFARKAGGRWRVQERRESPWKDITRRTEGGVTTII